MFAGAAGYSEVHSALALREGVGVGECVMLEIATWPVGSAVSAGSGRW